MKRIGAVLFVSLAHLVFFEQMTGNVYAASSDFSVNAFVAQPAKSAQIVALEALVGNGSATVTAIQSAIVAVSSSPDIDLMSVRNTVCALITQAFQSWIVLIDSARDNADLTLMSKITSQMQPQAIAFALKLDQSAGFKKYQELGDYLRRSFTLFLGSCAVYEIFVRDARIKDQISKNAQIEASLAASVDANRQALSAILMTLTVSDNVQQDKAARLATELKSVNNQRVVASTIMSAANLGQA